MFEMNLLRTIEDNEKCKNEIDMEREKFNDNISRLEVKNDEVVSD